MSTPSPDLLDERFADAVEQAAISVVSVHARRRLPSTGTIWTTESGTFVVTASHTVEREEDVTIGVDGSLLPATLLGRDFNTDLAVLQVPDLTVPAIVVRTMRTRVGNLVFAIGRPFGSVSATFGSITSVAPVPISTVEATLLIAAEVTPLPGYSGGPLIDANGAAHGINTSGLIRSGILLSSGRGFVTIPGTQVSEVVTEIAQFGRVRFGWIGVGVKPVPLPDSIREQLNGQGSGLMVTEVKPDSPATGRLAIGDTLVGMGETNHPLTDVGDLQLMLGSRQIGVATSLTFIRNERVETTELTPIERPERFRC